MASKWSTDELRLTKVQADFLRTGQSSVHRRVQDRTELILESRRMFSSWRKNSDGTYSRPLSEKGAAALDLYRSRGN